MFRTGITNTQAQEIWALAKIAQNVLPKAQSRVEKVAAQIHEEREGSYGLIVRVRNSATDFQSTPQDWALLSQIIRIW